MSYTIILQSDQKYFKKFAFDDFLDNKEQLMKWLNYNGVSLTENDVEYGTQTITIYNKSEKYEELYIENVALNLFDVLTLKLNRFSKTKLKDIHKKIGVGSYRDGFEDTPFLIDLVYKDGCKDNCTIRLAEYFRAPNTLTPFNDKNPDAWYEKYPEKEEIPYFEKTFTVDEFREYPVMDDYALYLKKDNEETDCDIGINIATRKAPVKIKVTENIWDTDTEGRLTVFCARDLKTWLNTNVPNYSQYQNTNPTKPWQQIVAIKYLTKEEIDEEEKKYNEKKDESNQIINSIKKKEENVKLLKSEMETLELELEKNYMDYDKVKEELKNKIQIIKARIRMLEIQIVQQLKLIPNEKTSKLKF